MPWQWQTRSSHLSAIRVPSDTEYLQAVRACGHIKATKSKGAVMNGCSVLVQSPKGVEGGAESLTLSYSLNVHFWNLSNMLENLFPQHTCFLVSLFQADAQGFCRISYDASVKQAWCQETDLWIRNETWHALILDTVSVFPYLQRRFIKPIFIRSPSPVDGATSTGKPFLSFAPAVPSPPANRCLSGAVAGLAQESCRLWGLYEHQTWGLR